MYRTFACLQLIFGPRNTCMKTSLRGRMVIACWIMNVIRLALASEQLSISRRVCSAIAKKALAILNHDLWDFCRSTNSSTSARNVQYISVLPWQTHGRVLRRSYYKCRDFDDVFSTTAI